MIAQFMGPYAPGFEPVKIMLSAFETMVDCRHYFPVGTTTIPAKPHLRYIYKPKTHIYELYPTLGVFPRLDPIELLYF